MVALKLTCYKKVTGLGEVGGYFFALKTRSKTSVATSTKSLSRFTTSEKPKANAPFLY